MTDKPTDGDEEYVCDHSLSAPDDVYWKWVTGDGYCMLCGRMVWAGGVCDESPAAETQQ